MPELNAEELAGRYGFAMAVLNSDPELKALFNRAVAQTYTPDRFQAELRASKWYQRNSEQVRTARTQASADPATYKANVAQTRTRLQMMAGEMGARMSDAQLNSVAEHAYVFGWDDNRVRQHITGYIKYTDGRLLGQAGQWESQLRAYASDMGVKLSNSTILGYVTRASNGTATIDDALGAIRKSAASAFPHLSDRLAAGETLADIADPYRQSMATLLEMDPDSIGLQDPSLRKALAFKDDKGRVGTQTLYDFENTVRGDKRWLKTKNAQDQAMSVTNRVLQDMGLIGG